MIEKLFPDPPRDLATFWEEYGILKTLQTEKDFAVSLAQHQLAKVDGYMQTHPNLTDIPRWTIEKTRNELETHVDKLNESLLYCALLAHIIECNKDPRKGVDYSLVFNLAPKNQKDLYDQALQNFGKAQEMALQAEKRNDELINKLATLCPGIGSPYQKDTGARWTKKWLKEWSD